jgi:hypothetical protein
VTLFGKCKRMARICGMLEFFFSGTSKGVTVCGICSVLQDGVKRIVVGNTAEGLEFGS